MDHHLSSAVLELQERARAVVERDIAPKAAQVDAECLWPAHSMKALAAAGLAGLQVPAELGGLGQRLLALSVLTETIGRICPSSALCFGMHCVGTAVLAAKATDLQKEKYLVPIAQGKHTTSLALSEAGTGGHFYISATTLAEEGESFIVDGEKQFITNGGHADSYVISTVAQDVATGSQSGDFSCLVLDADTPGLEWQQAWAGFGMRGNSSRGLLIHKARVPRGNLLGNKGDQVWYVFEVIAPFFLMAMAGTYLGIAQSAVEATGMHLRSRKYSHTGDALGEIDALQSRYAAMWIALEKSRGLVREAASRGDAAHPEALPFILACKADAAETAVHLANEAMSLCGGIAYRENSRLAQMLRDARAGHVMAPTTDLLKLWLGRALLGVPLL
ncbi:acyl-CoA dehydrogenase family protein [Ramlibacter sp.]|uniref:acyl-CoA dehydrogenase family protein n=1 Tax=Ramlibacter sp. TaxID=1917967 RepID=UPI0017F78D6F|nr:acyl-CoA dehydrogenase family protein [Ramlibacter sp.]MBA2674255.1 acyl-CoA/acyl-ACP dehydrogenase [Ramlibacter sp.]